MEDSKRYSTIDPQGPAVHGGKPDVTCDSNPSYGTMEVSTCDHEVHTPEEEQQYNNIDPQGPAVHGCRSDVTCDSNPSYGTMEVSTCDHEVHTPEEKQQYDNIDPQGPAVHGGKPDVTCDSNPSYGTMEVSTCDHEVHTPEEEQQNDNIDPQGPAVHGGKPDISCDINSSYGIRMIPYATEKVSRPDITCDSKISPHATEKVAKPSSMWQFLICLSIVVVVVLVCVCISLAVAVWSAVEVRKVSSSGPNSVQEEATANAIDFFEFHSLLNRLDSLEDFIYSQLNGFMEILSGQLPSIPASSCLQVSLVNSSSPSGYYWVRASNGSAVRVYCDMTRSCGGMTGGWTRVAYLQFENGSDPCPEGFRERSDSGIRTCGISSPTAACPSILFDTYGIPYSRVCGKILAYQDDTPDAFENIRRDVNLNIDSNYVDGVSLTHSSSPRQHIWTFAAALDEFYNSWCHGIICVSLAPTHRISEDTFLPPAFIGHDYFCDSGIQGAIVIIQSIGRFSWQQILCGMGLGVALPAPAVPSTTLHGSTRQLPQPTIDDIEMRVCRDQNRGDEDIPIAHVEIYVQ